MNKTTKKEVDQAWDEVQGKKKLPPAAAKQAKGLASMMADDSEEAEAIVPGEEKLGALTTAITKMAALELGIKKKSEELQLLSEEYNRLTRETIPDMFDEFGMSKFSLVNGVEIQVKREFVSSITEDKKPEAFGWLEKNGHSAIIKHDIVVKLKKGEQEIQQQIVEDLDLMGVTYDDKEYVHPQTLKAFVKEQMENGTDIPQEAFGIFPVRIAKITKK